jgi:hypothetical protein
VIARGGSRLARAAPFAGVALAIAVLGLYFVLS